MNLPGQGFEWWALKISGMIFLVFIFSQILPGLFYNSLVLVSSQVLLRPWTLITHIFMHADFSHLYFNLLPLALIGSILEKNIGSRNFLLVFFLGGLASSVADVLFYTSTLGASGAVFAVIGALTALRPRQVVFAFGVPMYIATASLLWGLLDLAGLYAPDGIAHFSHLFGLAYGLAYGFYLRGEFPSPKKIKPEKEYPTEKELDEWEEKWMK